MIVSILKELGYIEPKYKRNRTPLVLPAPNEEWEMDFGQIRIDEEIIFEVLVVVHRGTSRVIYLEGSEDYNAENSLEAVARLLLSPDACALTVIHALSAHGHATVIPRPCSAFCGLLGLKKWSVRHTDPT